MAGPARHIEMNPSTLRDAVGPSSQPERPLSLDNAFSMMSSTI
jgi:hypothetical protein